MLWIDRDVAYSGAYHFVVVFNDGKRYSELFTLSALRVNTLEEAKKEVADYVCEIFERDTRDVIIVHAEMSSERFA